jgi:hypothetical protein
MSRRHASSAELELYIVGALGPLRQEWIEAHCAACASCAAALAEEARLEVAFEQVAKQAALAGRRARRSEGTRLAPRWLRPVRPAAYGAAGLLAVAAAVMLWVGRPPASAGTAGEGTAASHRALDDGAILDARNDALDGG